MRTALAFRVAVTATALSACAVDAQAQVVADAGGWFYTAEELDNLLAPVALYPDPILAQVLVAASYPEQIELAAQYVQTYGQSSIDHQPWDISVKAVAHYTPVLNLMADRLDWTTALGQAYAEQPQDVMASVQSLRAMARTQGNLVTTREQQIVVENRYIRILPAQPRVVYVPVYDPLIVYHRPIVHLGVYRSGWSFGFGLPIGVWLAYDLDWRYRHVYYHGWDTHLYRSGWVYRSRPYIVVNNIYIQPRPRVVVVNRTVVTRRVDYTRFDRYNYVHRQVAWDRDRRDDGRRYATRPSTATRPPAATRPSWDRDGRDTRIARTDQAARNPSWDRAGRTRTEDGERRAVQRTAAPREQPQPEREQPRRDESARTQPRTPQQREQTPRAEPRPQQRPEAQRTQPRAQQRTDVPRAQPRAQQQRNEVQRAQQPPRVQQGSEAPRAQRAAQPRAQPQQREAPRAQPQAQQRSGQARVAPSSRPQQREAPRAQPQAQQRSAGQARVAPSSRPQQNGARASAPGRANDNRAAAPRVATRSSN